jgi:hypothetical protein
MEPVARIRYDSSTYGFHRMVPRRAASLVSHAHAHEDALTAQKDPESKDLCIHAGCRCEVEPGMHYCGDYCGQERQTGMEPQSMSCRCGHEPCGERSDPATHT